MTCGRILVKGLWIWVFKLEFWPSRTFLSSSSFFLLTSMSLPKGSLSWLYTLPFNLLFTRLVRLACFMCFNHSAFLDTVALTLTCMTSCFTFCYLFVWLSLWGYRIGHIWATTTLTFQAPGGQEPCLSFLILYLSTC